MDGVADRVAALRAAHPFLDEDRALRLVRAYGTEAETIFSGAGRPEDLGEDFGAGLTAAEVAWLMDREYAETAEDVLWRRTKLGLRLDAAQAARLADWMGARRGRRAPRGRGLRGRTR